MYVFTISILCPDCLYSTFYYGRIQRRVVIIAFSYIKFVSKNETNPLVDDIFATMVI
nr:MAG TPA: hypothetical protein [Bacteriophage sp.]